MVVLHGLTPNETMSVGLAVMLVMMVIDWGYGTGSAVRRAAGVTTIAIRSRFRPRYVRLSGRGTMPGVVVNVVCFQSVSHTLLLQMATSLSDDFGFTFSVG